MNQKNVLVENKLFNIFKALLSFGKSKKLKLSPEEKKALKNPAIAKLVKGFYKDYDDAISHFQKVQKRMAKKGINVD